MRSEPVAPDLRGGRPYLPGTNIPVLAGLATMLVPIAAVRPDPTNPRTAVHLDAVVRSMQAFGVRWPIVVNERTGQVEAGHQRLAALQQLGAQHVPVLWADDDGATARAFMIADNRVGEVTAAWDEDALATLLAEMSGAADDFIEALGFTEVELTRLLAGEEPDAGAPPPDAMEELMDRWPVRPGEVWRVGPYTVRCGEAAVVPPVLLALILDRGRELWGADPAREEEPDGEG